MSFFDAKGPLLELGSGCGDFLTLCAEKGVPACGVDRNPADIKGIKVFKKDIPVFLNKEKAGKYRGIYARHIMEHFTGNDLRRLMKNAHRLLAKKGKLVAILPNIKNIGVATSEFWKDKTHVKPYAPDEIAEMLGEAGFKVIASGPDEESWDSSPFKKALRLVKDALTGIKNEPPDYYVVAEKR